MRRSLALGLTFVLAGWLGAPAASASLEVGTTDAGNVTALTTGRMYIQTTDPAGKPSFAIPAGGGVVTQLTARGTGPTIAIVRSRGGAYDLVGAVTLSNLVNGGLGGAAARIKVQAGDRLAVYPATFGTSIKFNDSAGQFTSYALSSAPVAGAALAISGAGAFVTGYLNVAAVVEPDADDDGYGDETQDSCATSATVHDGPCTTDLQVSATATPSTLTVGEVTTVSAQITAAGAGGLPVTVNVFPPTGVKLLALTASGGGDCASTACSVGPVPGGASRTVYAVVQATAAGSQTFSFAASATGGVLVNPADDAASTSIAVSPPPIGLGAQAPIRLCTVPKLKGLTRASASAKLTAAGCAVGKITGKTKVKGKRTKVKTQTVPSALQVVAGTKVGFRLG